jgi:methyl-accepting chemotaxis protein
VASLSEQVSSNASQLNTSLQGSAVQLQKIGGSVEQIMSMAQQNSQETVRAKNLLEETRSSLSNSGEAAHKVLDQIRNISQSAEKVFQVVKTIEEIAFQTNILALNAGVEAVRAGEQGKEFVLVVEEIRNLSQRCAQVARETSKLVNDNTRQASEGLRMSEETIKFFSQTEEKAGKVAGLLSVMEDGSDVQVHGLRAVQTAVTEADRDAMRNAALGEKSGGAGVTLSQKAQTLRTATSQLTDLVKGSAKAAAPKANKRVAPAKAPSSAPVPVPAVDNPPASKEPMLAEKTGTDGKVVRIGK